MPAQVHKLNIIWAEEFWLWHRISTGLASICAAAALYTIIIYIYIEFLVCWVGSKANAVRSIAFAQTPWPPISPSRLKCVLTHLVIGMSGRGAVEASGAGGVLQTSSLCGGVGLRVNHKLDCQWPRYNIIKSLSII